MKGLRRAHRFGRTNRNKSALLQTSLSEVVGPSQLCFFLFVSFFAAGPPVCGHAKLSSRSFFVFFISLFFWSSSDGAPSHRELNATGSLTHNKPPRTREGERALIQVGLSPKGNQVFIISFFNLHPLQG